MSEGMGEEMSLLTSSTYPCFLLLCWVWETATLQQGDSENHSLRAGMAPGEDWKGPPSPTTQGACGWEGGVSDGSTQAMTGKVTVGHGEARSSLLLER